MWQSGPAGVLEVVEGLDARHHVVWCLRPGLGWQAAIAACNRGTCQARATLPSMCGRWPVVDSVKLRSLSLSPARPCKVPAAEGFSVEIFQRDLLEGRGEV